MTLKYPLIATENHPKLFKLKFYSALKYWQFSFYFTVHVNRGAQTPPGSPGCQNSPNSKHQHGLSCSHNTPSVCSPVVQVRQVLPSPASACSLEHMCLYPSVPRVCFFLFFFCPQFRNVIPACYRNTKSFVHSRRSPESHSSASPRLMPRSLCIHAVRAQLNRAVPPPHSPP